VVFAFNCMVSLAKLEKGDIIARGYTARLYEGIII
jgi:hypothetical protein